MRFQFFPIGDVFGGGLALTLEAGDGLLNSRRRRRQSELPVREGGLKPCIGPSLSLELSNPTPDPKDVGRAKQVRVRKRLYISTG